VEIEGRRVSELLRVVAPQLSGNGAWLFEPYANRLNRLNRSAASALAAMMLWSELCCFEAMPFLRGHVAGSDSALRGSIRRKRSSD
jgi:hypothetical protein